MLELLVSIAVVSILLALILPAVVRSREASHGLECKNHLRNLGMAMFAHAEASQRFPASGTFSATGPEQYQNWITSLLPWLDQANLKEVWKSDLPFDHPDNLQLARLPIPLLVCPSDLTAVKGQPNLSYVANAGFGWTAPVDCPVTVHFMDANPRFRVPIDLNGNGVTCPTYRVEDGLPSDKDLFFRTGMFFLENHPLGTGTVRHHTLDTVVDGLTNTISLSENVRVGYDPLLPETSGWAPPMPMRVSFFASGYVCQDLKCSTGQIDYRRANDQVHEPYRFEAINAPLNQPESQSPWPSSYHVGGVHVAFADGRVQFLSELVDGNVYVSLLSPQGLKLADPLTQVIPAADAF